MEITPTFNDSLSDPETFKDHIGKLTIHQDPLLHGEIIDNLIEKVDEIDFRDIAELDEKESIKNNHLLIITIEQLLSLAKENEWGICINNSFIYLYNGAYWNLVDKEEFQSFLGQSAEKMGVDAYKARYYVFRDQLLKQFNALANLPGPKKKNDIVLVNLQNGTYQISHHETFLRNFRREDFLTYQLPFDFDPKARAPLFEKYLNRVLPDQERQKVLAEYLGSIFINNSTLKLEKSLLLYGTGGNGKSVIFEILNALLGKENFSSYSLNSLTDQTGYYRAKIANKLVNYASEIDGNMNVGVFKQLVSGEPVEARLPYGEPFILTEYAKLIFNCNTLPKDVEHTNAFFRRFLIIHFDQEIPEKEQDKELSLKIIGQELSGVFNWILDGLYRLLSQKCFSHCESIQFQIDQYRKQSDSVAMFIDENNYYKDAEFSISLKDIYIDYRSFCNEDGYKPVSKANFRKRLDALGYLTDRKTPGWVVYTTKKIY